MRLSWKLALGAALAFLTGCGNKSLLGVKNAYEVSMTADNKSASPLTVTLSLTQAASSDNCEKSTENKIVDVAPQATKEDSLTLKCEHPPKNEIALSLKAAADTDNPIEWVSLNLFDDPKFKGVMPAGTVVRWHAANKELKSAVLTSADLVNIDGLKTPADEPSRVAVPNATLLPVGSARGNAKKVQIFFAPSDGVVDVGLPVTLFDGKPDSSDEVEGYYYKLGSIELYSGSLTLARSLAAGKIACDDKACSIDSP